MAHLESWAIFTLLEPYQAPEQARHILAGFVTDHPCMQDGIHIETSPIASWYDDEIITRSGTCYTLGEPDPDYEAKYPDARARIYKLLTVKVPR